MQVEAPAMAIAAPQALGGLGEQVLREAFGAGLVRSSGSGTC
jgi:hypothetical protein